MIPTMFQATDVKAHTKATTNKICIYTACLTVNMLQLLIKFKHIKRCKKSRTVKIDRYTKNLLKEMYYESPINQIL